MRRAGLFAVVMLLALPAGAEGAKRSPCKPKGAKTLDAGLHAHIFRVVKKRGDRRTSVVYGCLYRGAKRLVLGRVTHDGYYEAGVAVTKRGCSAGRSDSWRASKTPRGASTCRGARATR
jgi:hypothetical protein